jgi:hypothetical protein
MDCPFSQQMEQAFLPRAPYSVSSEVDTGSREENAIAGSKRRHRSQEYAIGVSMISRVSAWDLSNSTIPVIPAASSTLI